jgi:hypothetical protein
MRGVFLAVLPLLGVILGAYIQHIFARSKQRTEQIELRRNEAYADFLRGIAALAHNRSRTPSDMSLVADAKSRIAIYGSSEVVVRLGKFEEAGANLAQLDAVDAFLSAVEQMRREGFSSASALDMRFIRLLLFGSGDQI